MKKSNVNNENKNYMVFVLGYDLLQNELKEKNIPCDESIEICEKVYDEFLKSEEFKINKSEYYCLDKWVNSNKDFINQIIK